MFFIMKLIFGAVMIGLTVVIHAVVCDCTLRIVDKKGEEGARRLGQLRTILTLITAVFFIGSAIMADIWLWSFVFAYLDPQNVKNTEDSLYFATVTFTTVGYGDIVLSEKWRILAGTCAINGMIIFGWSTAFIFEIMAKLYQSGRIYGKKSAHKETP